MSVKKTCVHCASTRIVFEGLCREHYLETVFTGQPLSPDVLEPLFFNPWSAASHRLSRDRHRRMFLATEGMCGLCLVMPPEVIDHDHKCCGIGYGCGRCVRGLVCVSCNNLLGRIHDSPARARKLIAAGHPRADYHEKAITYLDAYAAVRAAGSFMGAPAKLDES